MIKIVPVILFNIISTIKFSLNFSVTLLENNDIHKPHNVLISTKISPKIRNGNGP